MDSYGLRSAKGYGSCVQQHQATSLPIVEHRHIFSAGHVNGVTVGNGNQYTLAPPGDVSSQVTRQGNFWWNNEESNRFISFFASALTCYPDKLQTIDATSRRVHISGKINGVPVSDITIDTATDIPCMSQMFIANHPTLGTITMHGVPPFVFTFRSDQGYRMEIKDFIRCDFTFGNISYVG